MKLNNPCVRILLLIILVIHIAANQSRAQSYGLSFASHDYVADQRTSLDLFPKEGLKITGNLKLSFDLCFAADQQDYFGYIFRIIENETKNIDLIYNKRNFVPNNIANDPNNFKLIIGERYTNVSFNIPPAQILEKWNHFELEFDVNKNRIVCFLNGRKYTTSETMIKKTNSYKVIFGVNNYRHFKTKDSPPIKIRNVKIANNGKIKFSWPLNEAKGNIAYEEISNQNGLVEYPLWIRETHRKWKEIKTLQVKGLASTAFNPQDTLLYIIGQDSLWTYSLRTGQDTAVAYQSGRLNLPPSNQSAYNSSNHTLYNFYTDRSNKTITSFDFGTKKWNEKYNYFPSIDYWHSNNFFSVVDSSLYVIGGYGQLAYKNTVQRYNLYTKKWKNISVGGDFYSPRYLAACGTSSDGKTTYLIGGYGSASGSQDLNPKNLYDFFSYDVKTKKFKKIYELKIQEKDFVFANSMIINEKEQTFTALIFSNHVYNSPLRLMVGSLIRPSYKVIGTAIPFKFQDNHSFANLYHAPFSRKLVAVTLLRSDNDNSTVKIYTLSSPPDSSTNDTPSRQKTAISKNYKYALIPILMMILIWVVYHLKLSKKTSNNLIIPTKEPAILSSTLIPNTANDQIQAKILLFGDLKLYNSQGQDITNLYTSLVRELFLMVLIYSLKSRTGISPEKLIELLWGDKSSKSAKNNRSANLSKLRSLLAQMGYLQLSKVTGNWKIEVDFTHIYIDYCSFMNLVSSKRKDKAQICALIAITQRGSFLQSSDYPWLDHIKSEVSNQVIDIYLNYSSQIKIEDDAEFLIMLANMIFSFDPVNEEAMIMKCKSLSYLGKHSLANTAFTAFKKEYTSIYGEDFKKDFHDIL